MSAPDRRALVDRDHGELSIRRQCQLLGIARSGVYRPPPAANDDDDLTLMRRIDALFTSWPFLGSRRMTAMLRTEGHGINRKRVQRLMRRMGIAALGPKPRTTKPAPGHKIFPYLLRGLAIERPNQVWCADITYIPIGRGFLYLVAVMDWASRAVLAWRLSNTMDGYLVLSRRAAGGTGALRAAGDLQHRPGQPVYQCGLYRRAHGRERSHLDEWSRPLDGQRVHRTAAVCAWTTLCCCPHAHSRKNRNSRQRCSQHDIRRTERSRIQLTSRSPWSRGWGPLHRRTKARRNRGLFLSGQNLAPASDWDDGQPDA